MHASAATRRTQGHGRPTASPVAPGDHANRNRVRQANRENRRHARLCRRPSSARGMDAYDIVDWRQRVFALYAEVRATPDVAAAHAALARRCATSSCATHAASPLLGGGPGVLRRVCRCRTTTRPGGSRSRSRRPPESRIEVTSGTDGTVPFERLGVVEVPGVGSLDVWRLASYAGGLFVPVKDASAGKPGGTYGGGRYLVDTVKGADLGLGRRHARARLQLRLQPVVRLRPGLGLPARAARATSSASRSPSANEARAVRRSSPPTRPARSSPRGRRRPRRARSRGRPAAPGRSART